LRSTSVSPSDPADLNLTDDALTTCVSSAVSDWLDGEGIPFFRLDGNTPQDQRQKDIDAFNAPGATTNLFILSTRGA
jgi:hypothetical protein